MERVLRLTAGATRHAVAPVQIVLLEPKIPQNTGNIIRLCACTGASLTIVGKPAFSMDDAHMRRAGLDYFREISIEMMTDWQAFLEGLPSRGKQWDDLVFLSRFARKAYTEHRFAPDQIFVFGNEPDGLPISLREEIESRNADQLLRIPVSRRCRSLNLAGAVTLLVYECLRQNEFSGLQVEWE